MKFVIVALSISLIAACANKAEQTRSNSNVVDAPQRHEKLQSVAVHTTENQTPKPVDSNAAKTGKWSQSGDPIDTTKFDGAIAQEEKTAKAKPADQGAKKAAAQAYFDRGFALTEARQYASALGDYRRALKHDPNHEESKKWIDQIISIYGMLKKNYPKEGEEPPPLPYKREKDEK